MELKFCYPGVGYSVESILEFTKEGQTGFWSEPVFSFFPQIDREGFLSGTTEDRRRYLTGFFAEYAAQMKEELAEKIEVYNRQWQENRASVIAALEEAFDTDLTDELSDLCARITFNPISPRYLEDHAFDVFYRNGPKGALGSSLHEIIHFVWFLVWQRHFHDDPREYETPHLKWIFSEMAVEPVMRDERLASLNPYYVSKSCVYPYFYTLEIQGEKLLDHLYDMYRSMPIDRFMKWGYDYCLEHESQIREHMEKAEKGEG